MLICADWSDWPHFHLISPVTPDKAVFVRQCYFVYSVTVETAIFNAPKAPPRGKEWICIFIQTNTKRPTSGRQYANVSCWRQTGIRFKNDWWFRVDSFFWETMGLIYKACVRSDLRVCVRLNPLWRGKVLRVMSGSEQTYTLFIVGVLQVFFKYKLFLQLAVLNYDDWWYFIC